MVLTTQNFELFDKKQKQKQNKNKTKQNKKQNKKKKRFLKPILTKRWRHFERRFCIAETIVLMLNY